MSPSSSEKSPQPVRRPLSFGRKLLFSSICLLLALLVCEAAVRARAYLRYGKARSNGVVDSLLVFDESLGLRIPRAGHRQQGDLVQLSINSLGFRGAEFTKHKPTGVIRIACLGASTTFCAEASSNDMAWPAQLERLLNERHGERFQVINAGVPGYSTDQSAINLRERVLPLDPDLVIVYHGNNDMAHDTRELAIERGIAKSNREPAVIQFLSRWSLLVNLAYKNIKIATSGSGQAKLESVPNEITQRFSTQLGEIYGLARGADCRLMVSTFVTKYRANQSADEQASNADVAFYYMPWMTTQLLVNTMERYNQAIVSFAKSTNCWLAEGDEMIPADADHFSDCMHLKDAGCAKMALRLADAMRDSGLVDELLRAASDTASLEATVQKPSTVVELAE